MRSGKTDKPHNLNKKRGVIETEEQETKRRSL